VRWPDEHGIGALPDCSAKLASERNRSAPAVRPIRIEAVSSPQPCSASSSGRYAWTSIRSSRVSASTVPRVPQIINVVEVDASAGFEGRVPVKAHLILRGDDAFKLRTALAGMSAEDAERGIRGYWAKTNSWIDPDAGSWAYDEQGAVLRMSVTGTMKLDWEGDDVAGRSLDIIGAGFTPPAEYRRPKEQDQAAPWVTEYPAFRCWATAIRLPMPTDRWQWDYRAKPVDLTMGGVTYWRVADLRDGVIRTVMSRRFDVPEISAEDAEEVNRQLPTFDNKISRVFEVGAGRPSGMHATRSAPPFQEDTDWMNPAAPCGARR